jgi:NACHT domain-containing protein
MAPNAPPRVSLRSLSYFTLVTAVVGCALLLCLRLITGQQLTNLAGMVTALATACSAIATPLLRKLDPASAGGREHSAEDAEWHAEATLAQSLERKWKRSAEQRGLVNEPMPVHWRLASAGGAPASAASPTQAREFTDLYRLYASLGTGGLIILGAPGTGKSAVGIMLLLRALEDRRHGQAVPLPVILSARDWNPVTDDDLGKWVAAQLRNDLAMLDASMTLLPTQKVCLILDGFDEMDTPFHESALAAINLRRDFGIVLLSRPDEFRDAIGQLGSGHVQGADIVNLDPVSGYDAANHLRRKFPKADEVPSFRELLGQLEREPDSPLTQALSSPFMLSLLCTTLNRWERSSGKTQDLSGKISELLDRRCFPDQADVENELLDRVLPDAYNNAYNNKAKNARKYKVRNARKWLGHIAIEMSGTRDLKWQEIPRRPGSVPRVLMTMLAVGVPAAFGVWLVINLSDLDAVLGTHDLGLMVGPGIGLFVGASVGLTMEYSAAPSRSGTGEEGGRGRRSGLTWFDPSRFNSPLALMTGCISGLAVGCVLCASSLVLALVVGTIVGVFISVATGLASEMGAPRETTDADDGDEEEAVPRSLLNRLMSRFSPLVAAACGLPVVAVLSFAPPPHHSVHALWGPVYGVTFGASLAVAFGLLDGFTRQGAGASVPISPRDALQRDFRASLQVGLPFGLAVGLIGGIGDGGSSGSWANGLLAGSVIGAVAVLVSGVAVSGQWRTRLAFLQLATRRRAPINGLRFLEDACEREVLRTAGPVYQFRHALLQDKLAKATQRGESASAAAAQPRKPVRA